MYKQHSGFRRYTTSACTKPITNLDNIRNELQNHMEEFLASGGKINEIPKGHSSYSSERKISDNPLIRWNEESKGYLVFANEKAKSPVITLPTLNQAEIYFANRFRRIRKTKK